MLKPERPAGGDLLHQAVPRILEGREPLRIGPWRRGILRRRRLLVESLVRSFGVVLLAERIEGPLLGGAGPAGLANEYSGYITTPEEFISQQYEGASTLFGRLTFDEYKEAFRDLGVAMASGKEVISGPPPADLSAEQILWAPKVDHDEAPIGQTIGQILRQPEATIARGPAAQVNVVYRSGNPRNDQRRNDTYFRIERDLGAGNWGLVAWDGTPDTRLYWSPSAVAEPGIGPGCPDPVLCYWSTIRIVWSVPSDAAPGRYRIRFFGAWKNGTTNQIIPYQATSNVFTVQ